MVLPIGDENRPGAPTPYVNIAIVLANVLVFVYMLTRSQAGLESLVFTFGATPAQIAQGQHLYTLVTSLFIHGGWLHIIGNMVFLWIFGDNIEAAFGHGLYALFYLVAGVLAGLVHILLNLQSSIPSIGASGAVAAVLGAYIVLFPGREVRVWVFPFVIWVARVNAIVFLGVWFLLQFLSGIASLGVRTAETGGVAF
ncbi:MAG: rhomboid family intramembrane serine protease, partial [Anaerolineae bacterium]|nr:rhomboid family intramembrane serine protease [Anaerolineae bacterium]